jgi:hypothetical protein
MDSDEVSSINDTIEALQVAQIIKDTYYEMINSRDFDHLKQLFRFDSAVAATPTHMSIPDNVQFVKWVKYNSRSTNSSSDNYKEITYLEPEEFVLKTNTRISTDSTVDTVTDPTGVELLINNDKHPVYYTSFDDEYVVFDAYDSTLESNLQQSMIQCYGSIEPTFSLTDTFVPDFPSKVFPGYLAEAKSTAFNALKQAANQKEEQKSRRQRRKMSRDMRRSEGGGIIYPDYGRK